MLTDVPPPPWTMSIGNCSSCSPRATSRAAAVMAPARRSSSTPQAAFARAAAALTCPSAAMNAGRSRKVVPETVKLASARTVWAP